jgi:hypothetical protein
MNDLMPLVERFGEVRARDIDLGQFLGYGRPDSIRKLIKRHEAHLNDFGPLLHDVAMVEIGSGALKKVDEFWLNREQAIYLTTQAGTPKARALTVLVVKVPQQQHCGAN